jgi:hypothetical protein
MPAITLGLAEVEERLRAVRRRLNSLLLLHAAFVSLSAVLLISAGLIFLGLRESADSFRIAAWTGISIALAVAVGASLLAHRRWLSIAATARLADQRGGLTDRLTTLLDLRQRPRPSRLAPVLVAQTLALGERWRVQHIAPRRVPRSVFLFAASILAFASTALMPEPAPPPPASAAAVSGANLVPDPAGIQENRPGAHGSASGELAGDSGTLSTASHLQSQPGPSGLEAADAQPHAAEPRNLESLPDRLQELPDQLQEMIRHAFHAEVMDTPRQLAARQDGGSRSGAAGEEQRERNQDGHQQGGEGRAPNAGQRQSDEPRGGNESKAGAEAPGHKPDGAAADQTFDGSSPAAGIGTSPGGLLDGKSALPAAGQEGPKTFKLTITSFLRETEQKGNQPRQSAKHSAAGNAATGVSGESAALNGKQLNDDALRKAEIPPEYEDLVRRVYSLRAEQ